MRSCIISGPIAPTLSALDSCFCSYLLILNILTSYKTFESKNLKTDRTIEHNNLQLILMIGNNKKDEIYKDTTLICWIKIKEHKSVKDLKITTQPTNKKLKEYKKQLFTKVYICPKMKKKALKKSRKWQIDSRIYKAQKLTLIINNNKK